MILVSLHRDSRPRCEVTDRRTGRLIVGARGDTPKQALRRMRALINAVLAERGT